MKVHESGLYVPDEHAYGSGMVELFSERGKKELEVPFDNYIGPELLTYQRWMSRYLFQMAHPKQGANGYTHYYNNSPWDIAWNQMGHVPGDGPPLWPFNTLLLTTADHPVDTAERTVKGASVGWANKQSPYSGADHQRGVVNLVDSVVSGRTYYRWVFDWPTNAANGTFQSIYWCGCYSNTSSTNLGMVAWLRQAYRHANYYFDHLHQNHPNGGWMGGNWLYAMAVDEGSDLGLCSGSQYFDGMRLSARPWTPEDRISARRSGFFIQSMAIMGGEVYCSHRTTNDAGVRVYPAESAVYDHGTIQTPVRTLNLDNAVMGDYLKLGSNGVHLFAWSSKNKDQIRRYGADGTLLGSITIPAYIANAIQYSYSNGVINPTPEYGILTLHPQSDGSVKFTFMDNSRAWLQLAHISATGQVISVHGMQGGSRPDWGFEAGGIVYAGNYQEFYNMSSWHTVGNLGTRTRLPDPVTKSNLQTMKITYQFDFADLG